MKLRGDSEIEMELFEYFRALEDCSVKRLYCKDVAVSSGSGKRRLTIILHISNKYGVDTKLTILGRNDMPLLIDVDGTLEDGDSFVRDVFPAYEGDNPNDEKYTNKVSIKVKRIELVNLQGLRTRFLKMWSASIKINFDWDGQNVTVGDLLTDTAFGLWPHEVPFREGILHQSDY